MNKVKESILQFNSTRLNRELRDYYCGKSFLDIHNKSRDEESHSGFIAWLLSGVDIAINEKDSPLINFLEMLIRKDQNIDEKLSQAILSRSLSFSSVTVVTEKKVKELSSINTDDELDIYVECDVTGLQGYKTLQIIIENKVMSPEEGPKHGGEITFSDMIKERRVSENAVYKYAYQTKRYYYACSNRYYGKGKKNDTIQLFIFLTPKSKPKPESNKFIHVTYQDVLDYVIVPLSEEPNLSERVKLFVNEYIRCLSLPSSEVKSQKRIVMALTAEEKNRLKRFGEDDNTVNLIMSCIGAILRVKANKPLEGDELLYAFYEQNRPLLQAASLAMNNCIFCNAFNSCEKLYSEEKYNSYYFLKDGKILNSTELGISFSKWFIDNYASQSDTAQSLNDKLKNILKASGVGVFSPYCIDTGGTYQYEPYKRFIIKGNGLWGTRKGDAFTKLAVFLSKNNIIRELYDEKICLQ